MSRGLGDVYKRQISYGGFFVGIVKSLHSINRAGFSDVKIDYCWGAPTGQASAQEPHSVQRSALISNLPSPSEIAPTGHSASQAPQEMQSSLI